MELKYWGISPTDDDKTDKDDRLKQELRLVPQEVMDLLTSTPKKEDFKYLEDKELELWEKLGPLSIEEIQKHSKLNLSAGLKFGKDDYYLGQKKSNGTNEGIGRFVFKNQIYEGQWKNG
mmetsp:Transcript_16302/g.25189  ORF Transcript_16302/g.25189 Transcript_16302/m.25189 type:complete len:119 (+) Transcript_16302:62-418(+)